MNAELLARNLAAHWVQSGLLVGAALMAMRLFKPAQPRAKLAALHLTLLGMLLLPLLQPRQPMPSIDDTYTVTVSFSEGPTRYRAIAAEAPPATPFSVAAVAIIIVITGIGLRLLWLCGGAIRLLRFRTRCREISSPDAARDFEALLGVTPRYVEHTGDAGPATFGIFGATVVLPRKFALFDLSTQRAMVCHELLHVKRRDAAVAAIEEMVAALLWFHPWIWLLRTRIRAVREQVVDRRVIELTGNRDAYVRCLVELSGHTLVPHLSTAMSSSRELRTRIDALFEEVGMSRRRAVICGLVLIGVVAVTGSVAAWAVPLRAPSQQTLSAPPQYVVSGFSRTVPAVPGFMRAPVIPVAPGFSPASAQIQPTSNAPRRQIKTPYAEYPQDAVEKRISGTVVVDVVVNSAGDVTTGAVFSGPQELRVAAFKAALGLKFEGGAGSTSMRINVEYRLTADSWGVRVTSGEPGTKPSAEVETRLDARGLELMRQANELLDREPPLTGLRIGGAIKAPIKTKDVTPIYPDIAREVRVQGVVIIEATVDERGHVSETRVLRSIPLLDQAAINAVKQWEYRPTLLNGTAVPVIMTVTVNFTLGSQVRLKITMPDGTLALLRVAPNGGIGRTEYPPMAKYGFAPFVDPDPSVNTVKLVIYELGDVGTAPQTLGNVELTLGGGVVQSATTPSFGVEVVSIER